MFVASCVGFLPVDRLRCTRACSEGSLKAVRTNRDTLEHVPDADDCSYRAVRRTSQRMRSRGTPTGPGQLPMRFGPQIAQNRPEIRNDFGLEYANSTQG